MNGSRNKLLRSDSVFKCYLNGKFYGSGDLHYMHELFKDYVLDCGMYGKDEVDFKIVKIKDNEPF